MFFDSHCHLTADRLASDFQDVIARAHANGVTGFLNIGDNLESSTAACRQAALASTASIKMWATVGVHPQHTLEYSFAATHGTADELRALAAHERVRAVGEIGLDFVYDDAHPEYPGAARAVQEAVLIEQLQLAHELQLPVVLHNRAADERLLAITGEYRSLIAGGVFHCFGSSPAIARRVLDLDFHLGFTGLVTFKNAAEVRSAAKLCPLERLLIETDTPYLAPVPHRGKINEPSYLPRVAETIAVLHGVTVAEIAEITTRNAVTLFNLDFGEIEHERPTGES
ncbi:MAG TPA: TatD family hydrolase [Abditibacteriaceae bacterium]|nr:TatD family hydrolase [Abditibacteriaceae bacterium]